ncbi:hypothetical protein PMAYCL1PPCAC_00541, partial [Pristionchus mayeri]
ASLGNLITEERLNNQRFKLPLDHNYCLMEVDDNSKSMKDYFDLLPNELISDVISNLPPKDRLNLRLNKRLQAIEVEAKDYTRKMVITRSDPDVCKIKFTMVDAQGIVTEKSHAIRRFSQIASVGDMVINNQVYKEIPSE